MEKVNISLSVETLMQWLIQKEPVFLLDVRPISQKEEWAIPESIHVDAYDGINKGDYSALDKLEIPKDSKVVTLCAAGRVSLLAADYLFSKGIETYSLEGGMKAWNYAWDTVEFLPDSNTTIIQVRRPAKGCLSYIVGSANEAIVIDASLSPNIYQNIATQKGWTIKYVMDTHVHADYVSRTAELSKATNAEHLFIEHAKVDYPFKAIANDTEIVFGKSKLRFLHTSGHTWESTSYLLDNTALFSGDTLFVDGIGRPDLKADEEEAIRKAGSLYESLHQIMKLDQGTIILPAHISKSIHINKDPMISATLGTLKKELLFLNMDKKTFIENILSKLPPAPPNFITIAEINKKGVLGEYNMSDLEAGANRCAIS